MFSFLYKYYFYTTLPQALNRCFHEHCWLYFCFEKFETFLKEERSWGKKNPHN